MNINFFIINIFFYFVFVGERNSHCKFVEYLVLEIEEKENKEKK